MLARTLLLLASLAAIASAELIRPKSLDDLILEAETIVHAEVVDDGAMSVLGVFRGQIKKGARIRVAPERIPRIMGSDVRDARGETVPRGTQLLLFFGADGEPIAEGGAILLHEGRAVQPLQFISPGPLMFLVYHDDANHWPTGSELFRFVPKRISYLEEVQRRLGEEPDPAWLLEQLRAANRRATKRIFEPSSGMVVSLGRALSESGSVQQRFDAFTLERLDEFASSMLGESLNSPESQELLWSAVHDWRLPDGVRARCVHAIHSRERLAEIPALIRAYWREGQLGHALCMAMGRLLLGATNGDPAFSKLKQLHATGPEDMRFEIALTIWNHVPMRYAALDAPCPPFPIRLCCDRQQGRNRFQVHRPHVDPPRRTDLPVRLILVPLRAASPVELKASSGFLDGSAGGRRELAVEGLSKVPSGRYWAYLRVGPPDRVWSESYGCVVTIP